MYTHHHWSHSRSPCFGTTASLGRPFGPAVWHPTWMIPPISSSETSCQTVGIIVQREDAGSPRLKYNVRATHCLLVVPSVLDGVCVSAGYALGNFRPLVPQSSHCESLRITTSASIQIPFLTLGYSTFIQRSLICSLMQLGRHLAILDHVLFPDEID